MVEKVGYGYSEDSYHFKGVMEVLSETCQVLLQANVQPVYDDASHNLYQYQSNDIISRIKDFLESN